MSMSSLPARVRLTADDRREKMIDAALAIFSERPYEAVSTADLANAAGTTRTNLNYHFGSKRNLYLVALQRFTTFPLGLPGSVGDQDATEGHISATFDRWLTFIEDHHEPFKVLTRARQSSCDPEVVGLLEDALEAWEDKLLALTGHSLEDTAARARIRAFQSMVGAAADEWLEVGTLSKQDVCQLLTLALSAIARI